MSKKQLIPLGISALAVGGFMYHAAHSFLKEQPTRHTIEVTPTAVTQSGFLYPSLEVTFDDGRTGEYHQPYPSRFMFGKVKRFNMNKMERTISGEIQDGDDERILLHGFWDNDRFMFAGCTVEGDSIAYMGQEVHPRGKAYMVAQAKAVTQKPEFDFRDRNENLKIPNDMRYHLKRQHKRQKVIPNQR